MFNRHAWEYSPLSWTEIYVHTHALTHTHTHTHTRFPCFMGTFHIDVMIWWYRHMFFILYRWYFLSLNLTGNFQHFLIFKKIYSVWFISLFPHGEQQKKKIPTRIILYYILISNHFIQRGSSKLFENYSKDIYNVTKVGSITVSKQ